MALRVLLGDESSTIKKVFQLALQDFAAEVCPVAIGLDMVQAARQFKPDIIFCDVLIQKRSGYEVAATFKSEPDLSAIPFVLMWSGFMELDPDKFQASQADSSLEKPFDVDTLRKIVTELVPKTRTQRLSKFLSFPKMPEMLDVPSVRPKVPPPAVGGVEMVPPVEIKESWSMESFDPMPEPEAEAAHQSDSFEFAEEFTEMPLPPPAAALAHPEVGAGESEDSEERDLWASSKINEVSTLNAAPKPTLSSESNDEDLVDFGDDLPVETYQPPVRSSTPPPVSSKAQSKTQEPQIQLSPEQIEKLVRRIAEPLIEEAIWKVVPEVAERLVERELKRLLAEIQL